MIELDDEEPLVSPTATPPIPVAQWGTGTAGLRALRAVLGHPGLELVGLYVARSERAGRDAGSFLDLPDTGVRSTNRVEELLATDARCLIYMGSYSTGGVEDVLPFLRAGWNVVTPTLLPLQAPTFAPEALRGPVERACADGGGSFFSSGASPGWGTDAFPMTILGVVDEVREVRVQEIADYSHYPVVEVARAWGFGARPGDRIPLFAGLWLRETWEQVPREIARRLGVEIDETRVLTDTATTTRDVEAAFYTIEAGTVANIRFEVQGLVGGHPLVVLEHVNYCDLDSAPAHWPRPDGAGDLHYRTVVTGRPNLTAEVGLDLPIAALRCVNAIPHVVDAAPGILAGADVPSLGSGNVVLPG